MTLEHAFTLTPRKSRSDPASSTFRGFMYAYGCFVCAYSGETLTDQYNDDKVQVRNWYGDFDGSPLGRFYEQACIQHVIWGKELDPDRELLFVFKVWCPSSKIQVFGGSEMVKEEIVSGWDNIAILMEMPLRLTGENWRDLQIFLRVASFWVGMVYYKVDCYLI